MVNKHSKKFWENRKVLVTGYEGFLGSWLTKTLITMGAEVIGVDKSPKGKSPLLDGYRKDMVCLKEDVTHLAILKKVIQKSRPRTIFHLAAEAIVGTSLKDPVLTFQSNIQGTWNVLESCRGMKFIENIILASSDKAYGSQPKLPLLEEMPLEGRHPYDVSKSCADLLGQSYHYTYGMPVCTTRCGNIYGPGDLHLSRIVPDAITSISNDTPLVIRSDGKYVRDYIYVEDVVWGYVLLAERMKKKKLEGQAFNFSCEKPMSVLELFELIVKLSGKKKIKPKILNEAKYEIKEQFLSAKKANKVLGWNIQHTREDSLKKTIAWYQDNLVKLNK